MKAILFPLIALVLGGLAGGAAGWFLKPPAEENATEAPEPSHTPAPEDPAHPKEFVKIEKPFIVPILNESRITATVIMMLAFEVTAGSSEAVYQNEPRLRDNILQTLYTFANTGGLDRAFISGEERDKLRRSLLEVSKSIAPGKITDVLIVDFGRQDQVR